MLQYHQRIGDFRLQAFASGQFLVVPNWAGQFAAFMDAQQMDPAPEPKAGDTEAPKVWAGKSMKAVTSDGGLAGTELEEGEVIDESLFVSWHGVSKDVSKETKSHAHAPACFAERDAFKILLEHDLADLPNREYFSLSYHTQSCQWHARNADGNNFAPTWGKLRSELKSLLMAVEQLWLWYLDSATNALELEEAQEHIARLKSFGEHIEF